MDVGIIIAIVIAALIVLALVTLLGRKRREQTKERLRVEAHEHREQAAMRNARADRAAAEAEERAARARREQALAEEQAATAQRERRFASETAARAEDLDPDSDGDGRVERHEETRTERRR